MGPHGHVCPTHPAFTTLGGLVLETCVHISSYTLTPILLPFWIYPGLPPNLFHLSYASS